MRARRVRGEFIPRRAAASEVTLQRLANGLRLASMPAHGTSISAADSSPRMQAEPPLLEPSTPA